MDPSNATASHKAALIDECEVGVGCQQAKCGECVKELKRVSDRAVKIANMEEAEKTLRVIDTTHVKCYKCTKCDLKVAKGHEDLAIDSCKFNEKGCGLQQLMDLIHRMDEKKIGKPKLPPQLPSLLVAPTDKCPLQRPCHTGNCGSCLNEARRQAGGVVTHNGIVEATKNYFGFGHPTNNIQVETKVATNYSVEVPDVIRISITKKGTVTSVVLKE